jgi:phage terminase large subunit-like protein
VDWTTACPDWESRIVERESLVPVGALFPDYAADAVDVFKNLRLVDATGSPLMGDTCLPWIIDIVTALFGAYDTAAGRRHITNYFLMVSKKNGKSSLAAGIMLTALIMNARPSGEFIILAPTKESADNAYKPIRDMIKADDDLKARFHEQEHIRTITDRLNAATLKVVAADSATVTGKKAIGVLVDELWEFGNKPKAEHMLTEATGGLASRPEGFVIYCTTQSNEEPAGVFKSKLAYARDVRDGRIVDKQFLPIIYEFPAAMVREEAYRDLSNAYITNPNWGVCVDEQVIEQKYREASHKGDSSLLDFFAKHLNVQIGVALRSDAWPGAIFWEPCGDQTLTLQELLNRSEVVVGGVDGGGLDDLLGLAVVGREVGTGKWLHWAHAWCHPIVLERRKSEASKFKDFEKSGHLTIVARIGDDTEGVADVFEQCEATGLLERIGADPSAVGGIVDAITARNIDADRIVGISQGWKLHGAIKTLERKLAEGAFVHGASPLMSYSVANARAEARGNAILITKQLSGAAKIDPLMATLNCTTLMSFNPAAKNRGVKMFMLG